MFDGIAPERRFIVGALQLDVGPKFRATAKGTPDIKDAGKSEAGGTENESESIHG
jgi:hypothetical protein